VIFKVFKSRFLKGLENQLVYYFYVLVAILVLFFLGKTLAIGTQPAQRMALIADAIREMRKYSDEQAAAEHAGGAHASHLDAQMQMHMRLFRAQRNFYISGFALFLCLVIRRLVALISTSASLLAEKEAAMKQAASASRAAEAMLDAGGDQKADEGQLKELKAELREAKEKLSKAEKDKESMKTQAENVGKEYDRLTEEYAKLERKLAISGGDKKDD